MVKPMRVKLVESDNQGLTAEARQILAKLNVEVSSLPTDPALANRFELPFLETGDRQRYFGIRGLRAFAKTFSRARSASR